MVLRQSQTSSGDVSPATTGDLLGEILKPDLGLIVLRNWRGLPARAPGTDIDVSISGGDVHETRRHIEAVAADLGWHPVLVNRRTHMTAIPLVRLESAAEEAIHFDVFDGVSCFGLPLIAAVELADWSVQTDGIRHLSPRAEALATLCHHLAWSGGIKRKAYLDSIATVLEGHQADWLRAEVGKRCGKAARESLDDLPSLMRGSWWRRLRVLSHVVLRSARRDALSAGRGFASYFGDHLTSLRKPTGMVCTEGALFPGTNVPVTLGLACRLEPHSFAVPSVRSPASQLSTLNAKRYERQLRRRWRGSSLVRWVIPTCYLWWQAKRGEIVLIGRPPLLMRWLGRRSSLGWIAFGNSTPT